ncbi:MAG: hypothetical protein V4557_15800 [Bacteroidota bacterium]
MRYTNVILLCFCCHFVQARTVYVSPKGNDRAKGDHPSHALRSINTAIGFAGSGDTVLLLEGIYKETIRIIARKGETEKPVIISGKNSRTIIDGGAPQPGMDLKHHWIELENTSWIVFENISFTNGWTDPVRVNNSSYISFRNCRFNGGRKVILATGANTHHVLVEDCYWDQGGNKLWKLDKDIRGVDAWLSMHHELMGYYNGSLIDSRASGGSFVIRRNKITNAYNGIRFTSKKGFDANIEVYENDISNIRDNDFEPEHYAFNLHIYHNRSHNIHKTLSVDDVAGGYIYYYGNTITMDSTPWAKKICSGFSKIYGGVDSLTYPLYFFNNSFFGYGKAFNAMEHTARMLKHFNNAYYFAGDHGFVLEYIDPTNAFDNDVSNKPWPKNISFSKLERNGVVGDVRFRNVFKRDLHLLPGSAAIDAGKQMIFPELGWQQSFTGKTVDAGAYENNELTEGPAFRFRKPENAAFDYTETPRIVRYKTDGNKLHLFFSDSMDAGSLSVAGIQIYCKQKAANIKNTVLSESGYEWIIETTEVLSKNEVAVCFTKLPVSTHGGVYTNWAAAIPIIHK